ncbi:hypothetical protein T12_4767 [Trichinella patagoniensis]|uniref:Uncharacterized protein n=1 Tax=Trichinella patagoniensis TaxID=990121 RepID=A0A0V0ZZT2_9BILA|nr:hypothetical protein T12_16952 [Trichinella patagoniensis]KRY18182.1 hypothetical protein T12_4767 [Trichinella patagoniensis]
MCLHGTVVLMVESINDWKFYFVRAFAGSGATPLHFLFNDGISRDGDSQNWDEHKFRYGLESSVSNRCSAGAGVFHPYNLPRNLYPFFVFHTLDCGHIYGPDLFVVEVKNDVVYMTRNATFRNKVSIESPFFNNQPANFDLIVEEIAFELALHHETRYAKLAKYGFLISVIPSLDIGRTFVFEKPLWREFLFCFSCGINLILRIIIDKFCIHTMTLYNVDCDVRNDARGGEKKL